MMAGILMSLLDGMHLYSEEVAISGLVLPISIYTDSQIYGGFSSQILLAGILSSSRVTPYTVEHITTSFQLQ